MKLAIVKYNAGNIASVKNALVRLGIEPLISDDADELKTADRVIFPGVGEASSAMKFLRERRLDETIKSLTQPVLGICLGMQLLCASSEENAAQCLGIVPTEVSKFESEDLKIPQIGWNKISDLQTKLFDGVAENSYVYFVHSFYVPTNAWTIATAKYGNDFSAAMQIGNFYAVQFHPEKSGAVGERILANFLNL